ncbi:hypothetical protein J5X84_13200 [Streptosporangiaceae bacterium NEAU-GS5]|nr:hypothetical protein [Streptosporangiaceae bacterium NEAU-GS5]
MYLDEAAVRSAARQDPDGVVHHGSLLVVPALAVTEICHLLSDPVDE